MTRVFSDLMPVLAIFWTGPRARLLSGLLLSATTVLGGLALLGLSGWFLTSTAIAGLTAATALAFDVFSPSAGIRFFALARTASRYGERLITHEAALGVIADLRERLFRGSAQMREAEKLRMRPASLLFCLTQDIDALDSLYLRVIVPVGTAFAAALASAITFGLVQPAAGIGVALFLLFAGLGIAIVCGRLAERPAKHRAKALETLRSRVIDLVSGQTELLMAGRLYAHKEAIAEADRKLANADAQLNFIEVAAGSAFGSAAAILLSATLFISVGFVQKGELTAPFATLVILVAIAALDPFSALRRGALELGRTTIAARRVGPRLTPVLTAPLQSPPTGFSLKISGLSARHPNTSRPSISDISLSLRKGERLALIGTSGAGKSTLLSVVAGELAPESGEIESDRATLLTQRTELFADTLRDNMLLANPRVDDERIIQALESAGLQSYLKQLPRSLDTPLGEAGSGLSGGEARRLALARLFLRATSLWLLDEPTEGLDAPTANDVIARLMSEATNRTLLIATHIRREAEIADRLVLMDRGCITACASRGEPEFDILLAGLKQD